jgi:RNA polymerase sigma-70 factor (ECF subfamily)
MLTLDSRTEIGLESRRDASQDWSLEPRVPAPSRRARVEIQRVPDDSVPDDVAWIGQVLQGDEAAASALVERLYPTVIKSVRCHLPSRSSEEDLAQAVFTKIFKHLAQFSGVVPLEHWVSRIAVNTCLNQLKHEAARPELRMSDLSAEQEAVVQRLSYTDDHLFEGRRGAARELLAKLLAPLRPDDRLVVTLLHLEEWSVEDISRLTGWSGSLVKVKAFRARHKMRRLWRALARDGQW